MPRSSFVIDLLVGAYQAHAHVEFTVSPKFPSAHIAVSEDRSFFCLILVLHTYAPIVERGATLRWLACPPPLVELQTV